MDQNLLRQLLEIFAADLDDQVGLLTRDLLVLQQSDVGAEERKEAFAGIMRSAHNIKGAARGLGLTEIVEAAHQMENLFDELRQKNASPPQLFVDLCEDVFDQMRHFVQGMRSGNNPVSGFDHLLEQMALAIQENADTGRHSGITTETAQQPPASSEVSDPESGGTDHPQADPLSGEDPEDKTPSRGQSLSSGDILRINVNRLDRISSISDELLVNRSGLLGHYQAIRQLRQRLGLNSRRWAQILNEDNAATEWTREASAKLLTDILAELSDLEHDATHTITTLRRSVNTMGQLTQSLNHNIRLLRLVPASNLLKPLARSARSIARELDKQVDINISGNDVEVDRLVLDRLSDPLTHLLRNAIDHGIENRQIRKQQGKPETGTIEINVHSRGNTVSIAVRDDGSGLDHEKITLKALAKNLITAEQANSMSEQEKLALVFTPGLSSRDQVTEISGRGVGLDVVQTAVQALNGKVSISTEKGAYSEFLLSVPATLATERGLLVECAGRKFAIPTIAVERTLLFSRTDIMMVEGNQVLVLDGEAIPLRQLTKIMEIDSQADIPEQDKPVALVISRGSQKVAFIVDDVIDERELVIKPLQPPLLSVRNVNGATYDDQGNVIVVLDAGDLVLSANRSETTSIGITLTQDNTENRPKRLLVVDDSLTTRTLEKNILEAQGFDVTVRVNGEEAWKALQSEDGMFDMVITDVEMPQMDGFELTGKIKQHDRYRKIPVIIVSSLYKKEHQRKGMEAGADAYIAKGHFESRLLLETVARLMK